tara:strand:+ start:2067 stop:3341 length:1275 start_codon:yes stop_codon:yes gene_type:complete
MDREKRVKKTPERLSLSFNKTNSKKKRKKEEKSVSNSDTELQIELDEEEEEMEEVKELEETYKEELLKDKKKMEKLENLIKKNGKERGLKMFFEDFLQRKYKKEPTIKFVYNLEKEEKLDIEEIYLKKDFKTYLEILIKEQYDKVKIEREIKIEDKYIKEIITEKDKINRNILLLFGICLLNINNLKENKETIGFVKDNEEIIKEIEEIGKIIIDEICFKNKVIKKENIEELIKEIFNKKEKGDIINDLAIIYKLMINYYYKSYGSVTEKSLNDSTFKLIDIVSNIIKNELETIDIFILGDIYIQLYDNYKYMIDSIFKSLRYRRNLDNIIERVEKEYYGGRNIYKSKREKELFKLFIKKEKIKDRIEKIKYKISNEKNKNKKDKDKKEIVKLKKDLKEIDKKYKEENKKFKKENKKKREKNKK